MHISQSISVTGRRTTAFAALPVAAIALLLLFRLDAADAHHSFAPLLLSDGADTLVTLDGTVRIYRLLNPHGAIIIDGPIEGSDEDTWLLELSPAAQLAREGWTEETLEAGDRVSVAMLASVIPNRGRLRAILVHGETAQADAELLVAYGIRGDTPVMLRLRERLPTCGTIDASYNRTECFRISPEALAALEAEFPGHMGYVLP